MKMYLKDVKVLDKYKAFIKSKTFNFFLHTVELGQFLLSYYT